jgi:hypothetical protein
VNVPVFSMGSIHPYFDLPTFGDDSDFKINNESKLISIPETPEGRIIPSVYSCVFEILSSVAKFLRIRFVSEYRSSTIELTDNVPD